MALVQYKQPKFRFRANSQIIFIKQQQQINTTCICDNRGILIKMGIIATLSDALSTHEDAFRLIVSILAGYPLAAIYRTFFYNKSPTVQHIYLIISGLLIYLFNCGNLPTYMAFRE
jgi:hypothetical protein